MAVYIKQNDAWVEVVRPYVKKNRVWHPMKELLVKNAGSWASPYLYVVNTPDSPEISLQIKENRYIKVGVRLPGTQHRSDVKRIRLLVSRDSMPKTQFGSGFVTKEDPKWDKENWSEWWYNDANPTKASASHPDTSEYDYKDYPVPVKDGTDLPGGQWYYFAAWTQDFDGNWSIGQFSKVWMPKDGVKADRKISKELNARANKAGSMNINDQFTEGHLIARESPRSNGVWYHDNKITNSVGQQGSPTFKKAQIRITRKPGDTGQGEANVRLFWHGKSANEAVFDNDMKDATVVGTLGKGETKWFDLPENWHSKLNTQVKGFGIKFGSNASDFITARSIAEDPRCGEVHLIWDEEL